MNRSDAVFEEAESWVDLNPSFSWWRATARAVLGQSRPDPARSARALLPIW